MKRLKRLTVLVIFMIAGMRGVAQEQTLDPITVTSSLSEKRSSETGRNIMIVRGEDISKLPVHSLDELLKYIPGVEVQSRGPQGAQSDISIRGGTYQQVLVILDGLRLNDPNTGHFSAYIPITPAQIDRIEVLKGASAAIYGSDAVGGVINIITRSFNAAAQKAIPWCRPR
ncbi:TonB-dependent receptor [Niabella hibiscisoli]|uniref:TonB-dependent receptor n=1 Tax=Niabella hibiscisoli TaxID=1825928 RepID=UPI001F106E8D|nr:TonB-dependent receptor plug domain-containing protein [Niabella hibiscisoli]MCH5716518.1 TonB-dependent receptor plug domain-containing protein [Niabella hibiscisoli]